ncbi:hypothetical protein DOTSEDRAFT_75495 [Dothistroma septosporum NZE10]|uniref:Uncharacterized protein n=1 Tax=Dothistroma septosporum (strain NZE10 / CBS 128990) TaxID=675120 RepID=M2WIG8_DOTSN|nr:hypothetical protein DOTSEDRAFT_75495 [Dothistroma septosporum NZE10]
MADIVNSGALRYCRSKLSSSSEKGPVILSAGQMIGVFSVFHGSPAMVCDLFIDLAPQCSGSPRFPQMFNLDNSPCSSQRQRIDRPTYGIPDAISHCCMSVPLLPRSVLDCVRLL